MRNTTNYDIDFIVPWVDGSDLEWIESFNKYCSKDKTIDTRNIRYRDNGLLKYWFRAIEKYAPWVRVVHFVTCGQKPEWLNMDAKKLHFVEHKDYIPSDFLPVFSSHPIELMMHNIPDLAEHFVYFNDDCFLTNKVTSNDFFYSDLPRDLAVLSPITKTHIGHIVLNDVQEINKHFNLQKTVKKDFLKWFSPKYGLLRIRTLCLMPWNYFTGFMRNHFPQPYKKSTLNEVWKNCEEILTKTMQSRFRSFSDVNQWLFRFWHLCKGDFVPTNATKTKKLIDLSMDMPIVEDFCKNIIDGKYKMVCINDEDCLDYDDKIKLIADTFEKILPEKSSFEL